MPGLFEDRGEFSIGFELEFRLGEFLQVLAKAAVSRLLAAEQAPVNPAQPGFETDALLVYACDFRPMKSWHESCIL